MSRTWVAGVLSLTVAIAALAYLILSRSGPEDERTAWTYRSPKDGFSLTLPSDHWRESTMEGAAAAFRNRRRGADAKVEVISESEEAFHKSIEGMRDYLEENREAFDGPPAITEGRTAAGDPYVYWTALS